MIRLYREVKGVSPPAVHAAVLGGLVHDVAREHHASLFYNTYLFLKNEARCFCISTR